MRRGIAVVVAVAVAAAIVIAVVLGTSSRTRLAGSNGIDAGSFNIKLDRGQEFCQPVFLPADADRVRLTLGSDDRPTPALDVTARDSDGNVVAHHRTPAGYSQGVATFPLGTTISEPHANAQLCVRPVDGPAALGGFADRARLEFLRPGRESYFAIAGTMLHRFGLGKPDWQGAWLAVVALLLVVAVWVLTARTLLREDLDG